MSTTAVLVLPFFIVSLVATGPLIKADSSQIFLESAKISPLQTQKIELLAQNSPILKESIISSDSSAKAKKVVQILATAYSSTPEETDSTPFITASGSHVRHGVIAANFLPFGSKVRLPDIFGDRVFTVEDRLKEGYNDRIDIWFPNKGDAIKFGAQITELEIL